MWFNIFPSKESTERSDRLKTKAQNREYYKKKDPEIEHALQRGVSRHFEVTTELSDDENELLIEFLTRHNMVLSYHTDYGFQVRKNDRMNPQMEKKIYVIERDQTGKMMPVLKDLARAELDDMKKLREEGEREMDKKIFGK
jgi:hypothetical protein